MAKGTPQGNQALTSEQILQVLEDPDQVQRLFGGAQQLPSTLGAPEQFFSPQYAAERGAQLPPDFKPWRSGDEATPGTWPVNDKARLQAMMAAAGLYGTGGYRAGDWTRTDAQALQTILEFGNYQGLGHSNSSINELVRRYAEMATTETVGGPSAPRAPLVIQRANPEYVRQVVRKSAMDLLGQRLSDEEEARIVSGFQAQDVGAQQARYAAGEAGGTVTEPLTPESYATTQLEGTARAGDVRYLEAFEKILQTATNPMVEGPSLTGQGGVR